MSGGFRICQPLVIPAVGGGGYRFLRLFEAWMTRKGHIISRTVDRDTDMLFLNGWSSGLDVVARAIWLRPDVTIVHRVDGSGKVYGRADGMRVDARMARVNRFASVTIHQSEWALEVTRSFVQMGPVIYNPVDLDTFCPPDKPPEPSPKLVAAVAWSQNPAKGAAEVYALAREHPRVNFLLIGRFPDAPHLDNLHTIGVLVGEAAMASALRACHALVTFSKYEACPNHVIEAMACGVPVLYLDSGAMAEVVGVGGIPITRATFGDALERAVRFRHVRDEAFARFHPDKVFSAYLDAMRYAWLMRPLRVSRLGRFWRGLTQ